MDVPDEQRNLNSSDRAMSKKTCLILQDFEDQNGKLDRNLREALQDKKILLFLLYLIDFLVCFFILGKTLLFVNQLHYVWGGILLTI